MAERRYIPSSKTNNLSSIRSCVIIVEEKGRETASDSKETETTSHEFQSTSKKGRTQKNCLKISISIPAL